MQLNRVDLAENTLRILKSVDEDNCLTALSQAWISVSRAEAVRAKRVNLCGRLDVQKWDAVKLGRVDQLAEPVERARGRLLA